MVLVVPVCVAAVLVGWLRGGRLTALGHVRLRSGWLVLVGFAAQVLLAWLTRRADADGVTALPLLVVAQVALVGFLWRNRLLTGVPLVLVGALLNAAVILANGAMPVAPAALEAVGGGAASPVTGKHVLLAAGDPLPWLADVLPVPPLRTVVSVGDVVLGVGTGVLLVDLMGPARRVPVRRRPTPSGASGRAPRPSRPPRRPPRHRSAAPPARGGPRVPAPGSSSR